MALVIKRLAAGLGAEVRGVDLRLPMDIGTLQEIERAWIEHLVLVFPGQQLDHRQHVEFSRLFGELDRHEDIPAFRDPEFPEILNVTNAEVGGRRQPVGRQWHSDLAISQRPARASMLRCVERPPVGGDTMFSNMYMAYEALSEPMRRMLDGLEGVHDIGMARHNRGRADLAEARKRTPPVAHPLVRVHPRSNRRALYLSEMTTAGIAGLPDSESHALLEFLFRHCAQPEFTYRHRWEVGDLVAWDNECTNHLALNDYDIEIPRRMYRTTLAGEKTGLSPTAILEPVRDRHDGASR